MTDDADQRCEIERLRVSLMEMTDDCEQLVTVCEHLVDVLEGKAEQQWDYRYPREKIAVVRSHIERGRASA
jgi:hypothetical protein